MSQEERLLRVSGLSKRFEDDGNFTTVLKGVDLELERGELVALLGPSGSGKTTLLSILGTLLRPTSGHYEMLDTDLMQAGDGALTEFRNAHIGFVFQFHHLLPDFTAAENVMFPAATRRGRQTPEMRQRAKSLLTEVGLPDRIDYRATKLSGGQKQRVALARALMNEPELILADEPTGNLDRESAGQVMSLIERVNGSYATTFLISTHDERIAERCNRRVLMVDGRISSD